MKIKSYNPANNELLGEVEQTNLSDIKEIVIKSKELHIYNNYAMLLKVKRDSLLN